MVWLTESVALLSFMAAAFLVGAVLVVEFVGRLFDGFWEASENMLHAALALFGFGVMVGGPYAVWIAHGIAKHGPRFLGAA